MYTFHSWQLRYLGHDSFQLTDGKVVIYIDPFKITQGTKADYILITHEHYDHFDPESVAALRKINSVFIGPQSVASQLDEMAIMLRPGEAHEAQHLAVRAVPAYNTNKQFHPQEDDKLGFILELDGTRLYHAGDTDRIPEMKNFGSIDIALLPVSGTYVMTAEEAAGAAEDIQPKIAIPMHYGVIVGSVEDAMRFKELANDKTEVVLLDVEDPL